MNDVLLSQSQHGFRNIKSLREKFKEHPTLSFLSYQRVISLVKSLGYRYKKTVVRSQENSKIKKARVRFLEEFAQRLSDCNSEVLYFDWSSYSDKNFQLKKWSLVGKKAVVDSSYLYARLHLFAILGRSGVIGFQIVRGNLSSEIVFRFVKRTLDFVFRRKSDFRERIVLVLDNSPLNHSMSLENFAVLKKVNLLFTAPSSSFLNPIEMFFAYVKQPLKESFATNKLRHQQGHYQDHSQQDIKLRLKVVFQLDFSNLKLLSVGVK